jgi:exodeoxyribonuclease V gamma subunit
MLHIHFSNRYELLTRQLLPRLGTRGGDAFAADPVIVPSAAVRRSLTLAIADAHGICANVQFSYLADWLWQQMAALLPGVAPESPFTPPVLTWRVYALLHDEAFVAAHARLAAYLAGADDVMRHALAGQIAGLLDQYITYRPDWLEAWRGGHPAVAGAAAGAEPADERWQAARGRRLAAAAGVPAVDPGSSFAESLRRIGAEQAAAAGLPASAHVFALPAMPALHIARLQQLGRLIDVHVYVLNPCQDYWFELIDRRRLSHLAARGRDGHHEVGHRLLAAWGRQTQAHVDGLVDSCGEGATDDAQFEPSDAGTLLARLQNSILELVDLAPGSVALAAGDRSLEVHVCHSLTRELEVLQDRLLAGLASGEIGHPSEVLVVTPDLDAAAPLIEAVSGTAPRERHIAFSISGRGRSAVSAPARALLALLALATSRFSASGVYGVLELDIVARRFGLDPAALQQVRQWLLASGARWGLDGAHRAGFGVPGTEDHTWAEGLDRLFLGYALPAEVAEPWAGRLPAGDAEGSDALALGALWQFVDRLRWLHDALAVARPPQAWGPLLSEVIDTFTAPSGDELDDRRELLDTVRALCETMQRGGLGDVGARPVPLPVLRAALEQAMDDPARGGVPTGGVTFTSMNSLRGLPFALVCLVGMNDGAFPTSRRPPEFDLMALRPRRGDRQRRTDERNLFLDLLLAARRGLHLSHTGRSIRDNAPLPPSVLIAELLEVLIPAVADDPADPDQIARARRRLVVEHPLQPFSTSAFQTQGDPRLRSFNRELGDALRLSLQAPRPAAPAGRPTGGDPGDADAGDADADDDDTAADTLPPFFSRPLPDPGPVWREVSLEQLIAFFRHPCRYLLKHRLGIELARADEELQDDEPFLPDRRGRTALAARLLPPLQAGADTSTLRRLVLAGGELPAGALGRRQLETELDSLQRFADRLRTHTAEPALPPHALRLAMDIDGEGWQLDAAFADLRPGGLVRWRYDSVRAGDALAGWIAHLALCAGPAAGVAPKTLWLALDETLHFEAPDDPVALLQQLVRLYRRGLREPLPFFPKAAWAYMRKGGSIPAAAGAWYPTKDRPQAEGADAAYRLALRGRGDALAGDFEEIAAAVFGPLLAHANDGA